MSVYVIFVHAKCVIKFWSDELYNRELRSELQTFEFRNITQWKTQSSLYMCSVSKFQIQYRQTKQSLTLGYSVNWIFSRTT
jgi:hypothetical protein